MALDVIEHVLAGGGYELTTGDVLAAQSYVIPASNEVTCFPVCRPKGISKGITERSRRERDYEPILRKPLLVI